MPNGELQLQEPPVLPEPNNGMSSMIYYAPTAMGSMGMVLIFIRPGQSGPLVYLALGLMAVSAISMVFVQLLRGASDRKRKMADERRDYLRYLSRTRRRVRKAIDQQRQAQAWRHPDTVSLASVAATSRLWERRPSHPDFSEARIGRGPQRLGLTLAPIQTKPVEDLEPLSAHALRRFIHAYSTVGDQPIAAYLRAYPRVVLRCEDQDDLVAGRALTRALLLQLAVFHSPDDLRIVVVAPAERQGEWTWTKWLPHALHPHESDAAGPVRLMTTGIGRLEHLLGPEFAGRANFDADVPPTADEPYTVVVYDGADPVPKGDRLITRGYRNAVLIDLSQTAERAPRRALVLRVTPTALDMVDADPSGNEKTTPLGVPDAMELGPATALARQLAPHRISTSAESSEPLANEIELSTMLGISDLHSLDVNELWERWQRTGRRLKVPLAITADGMPMELDIKEAAQGGMGPHGLLIGATGSGKSELLRTLVLALALTHSSETLNFVLVDFKGGATFLGLDQLPHTSAVITNLADEASLVGRMKDSLQGELMRRQELLRAAGNYSSVLDYETARSQGAPLAPLPSLFLVVDEFSELLAAHREFMDVFVMIGRLGRSLGVHLLLASQRLDEGRTNQLESHLSYRIGLRTFSAMESRGVLGVPDAYQLPSQPGNGFIRTDVTTLTRFRAAYVSGAYRVRERVAAAVVAARMVVYGTDYQAPVEEPQIEEPQPDPATDPDTQSLLEVAVSRLKDSGPPAHQVWLPPLTVPPSLDELLPPLAPDPERGLTTLEAPGRQRLTVPVGLIDRPYEQVRDLLTANLSGQGGHVGIAGGPQSGKSTMLRTLIAGLSLTHSPQEVQFYCLDFGGGSLTSLTGLPHLGGVTGRHDLERIQRTVKEITQLIARREHLFAQQGIASITDFRRLRAEGRVEDPHGDVFLVVDGWNTIRQEFPDLVQTFTLIANRGLNYGVHLVIAATRWSEIGTALRDQLGTRFELRLGDPIDSLINMRAARTVPKRPGAGITDEQLHFMTALPRIDGRGSTDDLGAGVTALVEDIKDWWTGPLAPPVRMLPAVYEASDLPAPDGDLRMPLGIEENELLPFWHDFEQNPHLLVVGDVESGKTNLLRLVAGAIAQRYDPSQARIALVDTRRELYESVSDAHRLAYAVSTDVVKEIVGGTARAVQTRVPGPDITPDRLRKRDWWKGPQMFFIVDDLELISGGLGDNPFGPLLPFLAQGTELGLHMIVARSANGLSRGLSDPLMRRLMETNTPTVMLSTPPSEGAFIGNVKPRVLPPGRALHITRRGSVQIQTAMVPDRANAGH
ncbi:type VII secretion protein EccCa [Kineosporia sp. J2-2]|uniref:Type VII secretion protein EccCa n=1 Tax=Kineosporia corallincola TaxID=2835133 RepID=A0ABS5TTX9_9ACTN|nr:type VII secretion protein EccCa [Kineosporia corallincola]MBT0774254.1 type VII secretion protein EccCa [Kineosporia corallincola]